MQLDVAYCGVCGTDLHIYLGHMDARVGFERAIGHEMSGVIAAVGDGVDGLACTTGIVLSLSIATVTLIMAARPDGLLISLILAGALCGFLIYNFPPARMFLGDSGSMLIGLFLGAVALKCSIKDYAAAADKRQVNGILFRKERRHMLI